MAGDQLLVSGIQAVRRLIRKQESQIARLYVSIEADNSEKIRQILRLARKKQIPVNYVPPQWFKQQGLSQDKLIAARISMVRIQPADNVLKQWIMEDPSKPLVVLDRITDQRNIGAIIRTMVAFGLKFIALHEGTGLIGQGAVQASAGAINKCVFGRFVSSKEFFDLLENYNCFVLATTHKQGTKTITLPDLEWREKSVIVLGNEEKGVSPFILERAEVWLRIPTGEAMPSLNVSVAAGIVIYDWWTKNSLP